MFEVVDKQTLAPGLVKLRIEAKEVAGKVRPGQFVIVRVDEKGERIPLSVADWDEASITVVVQDVGVSTRKLAALEKGDYILNLAGPLGTPSKIENYGTVVVVGGCFGIGPGYALARALKEAGNKVIFIVEARNKNWLFWQNKLKSVCDHLITTCGDGSAQDVFATNPLTKLLGQEKIDRLFAVGCTFMMMEIANATRPFGVKTRVSLMPLMVDGTGMCGACRCTVAGEVKFGCVDGPEFDGHQVNWDLLIQRMRSYLDEETSALDLWERENWHKAIRSRGTF
jgi:ferredoxin/flavodoxin---NADP+ reductase